MDSFPELKTLYLNQFMSDITLVVNGDQIPAHKLILSAKSEVFKAMFFSVDMVESNAKQVDIKDTNTQAFYVMLRYVYTEKFELNEENDYEMAINVYKIAHRFRFERLVHSIEQWFTNMVQKNIDLLPTLSSINYKNRKEWHLDYIKNLKLKPSIESMVDSIADVYQFATLYEMVELMKKCTTFLLDERIALIIIHKKSFLCQSLEIMFGLLKIMNSCVSQTVIINGLKSVLEFKPNSDMKLFESLIKLNDCSIHDIISLRVLKLFSDDFLFDIISSKYSQIINQKLKRKVIEIHYSEDSDD